MRITTFLGAVAIALTLMAVTGAAQAAPRAAQSCVDTPTMAPSTSSLIAGLGLTPDQVRATRARLSQLGGFNYAGLNGLGLTPTQIAEIQRRINAQRANAHPAGWPCAPFKNEALVMKFVRAKLVYNGFRPAMQFFKVSTRQFRLNAIQDGIQYYGVVAKTGARQITLRLDATHASGGTYTFNVPFEA